MAQYRNKPVIIEATQWFPGAEIKEVITHKGCGYRMCPVCGGDSEDQAVYFIKTGSEIAYVRPGDYVITYPSGRTHILNKDTFEHQYEIVQ